HGTDEVARQDADHCATDPVDLDLAAHDGGIACVEALPGAVSQEDGPGGVGTALDAAGRNVSDRAIVLAERPAHGCPATWRLQEGGPVPRKPDERWKVAASEHGITPRGIGGEALEGVLPRGDPVHHAGAQQEASAAAGAYAYTCTSRSASA